MRAAGAIGLAWLAACRPAESALPQADEIAYGLETVWSMAFAPDGRLFLTERPGRIRVVAAGGGLAAEPWAVLAVVESAGQRNETGLMGLALDPRFPAEPYVYVCLTAGGSGDRRWENRVVRLREQDGRGVVDRTLVSGIPAARYHNGCRLAFAPDGTLFVTTGDAEMPELAQLPASLAGKVLRVDRDGDIPADNPTPGSPVFSLGHRNPQGLAWDSARGAFWLTEHGTSGPRGSYDEVNLLRAGGNYGWPVVRAIAGDARFIDPVLEPYLAPAGAVLVRGGQRTDLEGRLLIAGLSGRQLRKVLPLPDGSVRDEGPVSEVDLGRLRDVALGPDGCVYVATSNRDGRGEPAPTDDRVIRLSCGARRDSTR
ncbi:MAG TPA: PQQ-dependent sugar dehydrogenase [Gemmatimonadales bacterium]|nr:PQQ-dependent sugar dehydrogenase [Gemmatimonadales bacterium]